MALRQAQDEAQYKVMRGERLSSYRDRRTEQEWREEIIRVCRLLHEKGYVAATDGNVSVRLSKNRILSTPSGFSKGFLAPEQLVVTDLEGKKIPSYEPAGHDPSGRALRLGLRRTQSSRSGRASEPALSGAKGRSLEPTSELLMHIEAYRQRPDISAVIHAHPPICVALSIAGISLAKCLLPEVIVTLGLIPTAEYATPSSAEGRGVIRDLIVNHDALIIQRHGTLTVGEDPFDAYLKLEKMEYAAHVTLILHQLGREALLPRTEVAKLLQMRREKGLAKEGEEEEFFACCAGL
jgi:L-fuculose-phosphate aldolase